MKDLFQQNLQGQNHMIFCPTIICTILPLFSENLFYYIFFTFTYIFRKKWVNGTKSASNPHKHWVFWPFKSGTKVVKSGTSGQKIDQNRIFV